MPSAFFVIFHLQMTTWSVWITIYRGKDHNPFKQVINNYLEEILEIKLTSSLIKPNIQAY